MSSDEYKAETRFYITEDSGMVYNLKQNGWDHGKPKMCNDIYITINAPDNIKDRIAHLIQLNLNNNFKIYGVQSPERDKKEKAEARRIKAKQDKTRKTNEYKEYLSKQTQNVLDAFSRIGCGTTCSPNYLLLDVSDDNKYIMVKHQSHSEYLNRMSGSENCKVWYGVFDVDKILKNKSKFSVFPEKESILTRTTKINKDEFKEIYTAEKFVDFMNRIPNDN